MQSTQSLQHPFGVTAYGSSIIRVEPDLVSIRFSVSRLEQNPKDAFSEARATAEKVQAYLRNNNLDDYGSSQISLDQTTRFIGGESKFLGYTAKIDFHVLLRELDQVEEILIGITDAGVNIIRSVNYQTSRLKELRAKVRKVAVAAALEKAELYCNAANVTLGSVIHIEDVNPDQVPFYSQNRRREGHALSEVPLEDDESTQAFNPSSIVVSGAVLIACEIVDPNNIQ